MGIDWQSVIYTAIVGVGGTAIVSGAAAWLLKAGLSEWLVRETEAFKDQLRTKSEMEIEKLKSSLQIAAAEHQVMFSKMHEKRATVIEAMYEKLTKLQLSAETYVTSAENSSTPRVGYDQLHYQIVEYASYIEQHRIFLPVAVCDLLKDHLIHIRKTVHIASAYGGGANPFLPELAQKSQEAFTAAYKAFNDDIPAARELLETEFRKMLGVK